MYLEIIEFYLFRWGIFFGYWYNVYVVLSILGFKIDNLVNWMVDFKDRVVRRILWKVLEGMGFILLVCLVFIIVFNI